MSEQILFLFGRFHPLIVHLPIGFLIAIILLEFVKSKPGNQNSQEAQAFLLNCTVLFAVIAVLSGLGLKEETGYSDSTVAAHKWFAIAFCCSLIATRIVLHISQKQATRIYLAAYRSALLVCLFIMSIAAHHGGNLLHGEEYLTEYLPWRNAKIQPRQDISSVALNTATNRISFEQTIKPIFKDRCIKCHGPKKQKGDFRIDDYQIVLTGGESGQAAVVPGKPELSKMMELIRGDDPDDIMPPKGEPLTNEQIDKIERWIKQGANWGRGFSHG